MESAFDDIAMKRRDVTIIKLEGVLGASEMARDRLHQLQEQYASRHRARTAASNLVPLLHENEV